MDYAKLKLEAAKYPKPPDFQPSYGTAGFRAPAHLLPSTFFRCGVLMAARALQTGGVTGLVVTASHNPEEDNGVKLVEPSGHMLAQSWEAHANALAAAEGEEALAQQVQRLLQQERIQPGASTPVVMLAHDTRPSAEQLLAAAVAGVAALGGQPQVAGLLTTPQLHWMVRQRNARRPYSEADYFAALANAFGDLLAGARTEQMRLVVDCANGVGAPKLRRLAQAQGVGGCLQLWLRNTGDGTLNGGCGADFIQKERRLPAGFEDMASGSRCASIDGDADRLVYFRQTGTGLQLLDGDKIAALAAMLVRKLLGELPPSEPPISVGIVQTAYANGASTAYLRDTLKCEVALTPTGVKYLHAAAEAFDVGIYFEANGHGTVLFSPAVLQRLRQVDSPAARQLLALSAMINQAVGDALSCILLVEGALRLLGWGLDEWAGLYTDLPSRQLKVAVADRGVVTTTNAETVCATPDGLQARIEAVLQRVPSGRAFVRPSGTEDVLRVYAEAATPEAADELARSISAEVFRLAGGIGDPPAH